MHVPCACTCHARAHAIRRMRVLSPYVCHVYARARRMWVPSPCMCHAHARAMRTGAMHTWVPRPYMCDAHARATRTQVPCACGCPAHACARHSPMRGTPVCHAHAGAVRMRVPFKTGRGHVQMHLGCMLHVEMVKTIVQSQDTIGRFTWGGLARLITPNWCLVRKVKVKRALLGFSTSGA